MLVPFTPQQLVAHRRFDNWILGWRSSETAAAGGAAQTPKAHMNMLQLMRAFPFPHANVLFDAQAKDPVGPEKKQSMVYSV
jgi:hypothetical protein